MAAASTGYTLRLEQCLERIIDNRGKTPPLSNTGIELIEVNAIEGGRKSPSFENVRKYVSDDTYATWFRSGHPKPGDTLISTVGAIGRVAFVRESRGCIAQNVVALRPKHDLLDGNFLYYYLSSEDVQQRLLNLNIGVAQPSLKVPHLLSLAVDLPQLPTQRRIAGILSAYDDLIENNHRRIRILEEMARALYREWFVHFRFPGHETVPRIPSSLGPIPEGWEVKAVSNILVRRPAGTVYREADLKPEGSTPVIDQSANELLGFHDGEPDHLASHARPLAIFGDHTCKMQLLIKPFSVGPNVVPFAASDDLPTIYVFHSVRSLVQTQEYKRHWIPLNAKELVVADQAIARRFASLVQPTLMSQETLRKMTRNLRRTRDLLLPRLLSEATPIETIETHATND